MWRFRSKRVSKTAAADVKKVQDSVTAKTRRVGLLKAWMYKARKSKLGLG